MTGNLLLTVPLLRVSRIKAALAFYCEKLGYEKLSEYRPHPDSEDPAYVVLKRDETGLHLSSFSGDGQTGGRAVVFCKDVDSLHREFGERGVDVGLEPTDQSWGNREMYLADPDGNQLRYTQPAPDA